MLEKLVNFVGKWGDPFLRFAQVAALLWIAASLQELSSNLYTVDGPDVSSLSDISDHLEAIQKTLDTIKRIAMIRQ